MTQAIRNALTDHSGLDNTGDTINGSEVDENAFSIADILDGTTSTALGQNGTVSFSAISFGGNDAQVISTGDGSTNLTPDWQFTGTTQANATALLGAWSTTATRAAAPTVALLKSGNATVGSKTVVTDGEILGSIIAYGDDGTDYESPAAAIEFAVDGTPGTGDMPGEINFYTTTDAGEMLSLRGQFRADGTFQTGVDDTGFDVIHYGDTTGKFMKWDTGTDSLELPDNTRLTLGTGQDADIYYDGTNLVIEPQVSGSGDVVINDAATLFLNDTANGNMTTGITVNQGAADDQVLAFKSSDVNTGATSIVGIASEVDDFFTVEKAAASLGGVQVAALGEDGLSTLYLTAIIGGDAPTTQSTAAVGLCDWFATETDGANAQRNPTANGVYYCFRGRNTGGSNVALFLIDEDGDFRYDGADGGAYDFNEELGGAVNDVHLCRAFDLEVADPKSLIKTQWDTFVEYNMEHLTRAGVLSEVSPEDRAAGHRPMVSGRQLARLHNGAIWQNHTDLMAVASVLTPDQRAALPEHIRTKLLEN